MKKPFFLKVFGGYVLIILALSALIALLSFASIRRHYESTLATELEYLGRALNTDIQPMVENAETQKLDAFLKQIGTVIHARVTVIDPQGIVRWEGFPLLEGHELTEKIVADLLKQHAKH